MQQPVYVFDPTANDKLSRVRGVGRYLQILRENLSGEFKFINNLKPITPDSIFINPFFNFLQSPLTLKKITKKQIAVIHDLIPLKYPKHFPPGMKGAFYVALNKLALKNYDLIITDSQASKKDIISLLKVKEDKVKVIYPCLPKSFTNSKFRIQNSESRIINSKTNSEFSIHNSKFCLYVGDATWNKNLVNLAKAIKIINVTCLFVGKVFENCKLKIEKYNNPWQKELKEFLAETKGDKRFIFTGFLPDNQLLKLYQQARLNILVSHDEGFGFSYVEAAYNKCPSVLSDISVLREISGGNGLFCDPNNPYDIADKIGEVYFNDQRRNKLGLEAHQQAKNYTASSFKRQFLNALNSR